MPFYIQKGFQNTVGVDERLGNCSVHQMHSQSTNICFSLHTLSMTLHMEIKLR